MKSIVLCLLGVALLSITVDAQEQSRAFGRFEQELKSPPGGYKGNDNLSRIFNEERKRLGDQVETDLIKYLGNDTDRYYWSAIFLIEPDCLHGSEPLPKLAMRILDDGLKLLKNKTDEESVGTSLSFNVIAAVVAKNLGLTERAALYKSEAELRLSSKGEWGGFFPALGEDDRKIYDSIATRKTVRTSSPVDSSMDRPATKVSGGVLNSRARILPVPHYPANVDVSGQVVVSIVYDETGKVIWARAINGPPPLLESAVSAALKTVFPPFRLEGKPEKVSGVLIYNFVR